MANDDSDQEKSEHPTSFKLDRARKKGVVARGLDLGFLTGLSAFVAFQWVAGPTIGRAIVAASRGALTGGLALADGRQAVRSAAIAILSLGLAPALISAGVVFAGVLIFELIQTGFVFAAEPLKPDFSRLNPANGFKRVFSFRAVVELLKNLLKLVVYGSIIALVICAAIQSDAYTIADAPSLQRVLDHSGMRLLGAIMLAAAFFAVLDQIIVRTTFTKKMRMSRRELRRELREREGEPRLKQKRKQLHREYALASRSLKNIKMADVLITNPEHIALGLAYNPKTMLAPTVVSIGVNHLAQRLKRLALVYNIPVIENRALAQSLYRACSLQGAIPDSFYHPVADIYNAIRAQRRATETGALS